MRGSIGNRKGGERYIKGEVWSHQSEQYIKKVSILRADVYIADYSKRSSLYFCTAQGINNRGRRLELRSAGMASCEALEECCRGVHVS